MPRAGTRRPDASCTSFPPAACSSTLPASARSGWSTPMRPPPTSTTSRHWPRDAGSGTAPTPASPAAPWPPRWRPGRWPPDAWRPGTPGWPRKKRSRPSRPGIDDAGEALGLLPQPGGGGVIGRRLAAADPLRVPALLGGTVGSEVIVGPDIRHRGGVELRQGAHYVGLADET